MKAKVCIKNKSRKVGLSDTYPAKLLKLDNYHCAVVVYHNNKPYAYEFDYSDGHWVSRDNDKETTITLRLFK